MAGYVNLVGLSHARSNRATLLSCSSSTLLQIIQGYLIHVNLYCSSTPSRGSDQLHVT